MIKSIHELKNDLEHMRSVLAEGVLLSHAPELRRSVESGLREIMHKTDGLAEENLVVGLLGGTGVGKSSMMNALAGRAIASESHRRPHTDQVLVYRHESTVLPSILLNAVAPLREVTHDAESIAQIVLCDLPDFDSLVQAHRRAVIDFLTHLDLLVWVTTPEKYADGGFYDFLALVPKSGRNFIFVLNKADLLFETVSISEGYDRLSRVVDLFVQHLVSHDIEEPLVYAVSARHSLQGPGPVPWNQFDLFRRLLFQRREMKDIAVIKSANLDVEKQHLLKLLEDEMARVRSLVSALEGFDAELEQGRPEWIDAGRHAVRRWIQSLDLDRLAIHQRDRSLALAGPAALIAWLAQVRDRAGPDDCVTAEGLACGDARGPLSGLRRELDRVEDRMAHRVLRAGLSQGLVADIRKDLACEERWQRLVATIERKTDGFLTSAYSVRRRTFKFGQYVSYGGVFLLFIISLSRGDLLTATLQEPNWSRILALLAYVLLSLFSPAGLAALGSLAIIQLFLGLRFYKRHKKWLQQRTQRFIQTLEQELERIWGTELDGIVAACRQIMAHKDAAVAAFDALNGVRRRE